MSLGSTNPGNDAVLVLVVIGVLNHELGLPHSAQARDRLSHTRLACLTQDLSQSLEHLLASGEVRVPGRQPTDALLWRMRRVRRFDRLLRGLEIQVDG